MPLNEVQQEYKKAIAQGTPPVCPYCHAPLEITQTQSIFIFWKWNNEEKRFERIIGGGDADKPYCVACETKDWDLIDHDLVDYRDEASEVAP